MPKIAVVMGAYPPEEHARREKIIRSHAGNGIEVGIITLRETAYVHALTPADLSLAAPPFMEAFSQAEQQGYDAVVPLGVLDLGVDGGRSMVKIPVVGPCESCLAVASQLGDRFGLLVYTDAMIPFQNAIVRRYRMEDRIAGWRSANMEVTDLVKDSTTMLDRLAAQSRSLIEQDRADVIISLGISQCPVHVSAKDLSARIGVPVVEGIGSPIRMAALLVGLGLTHSRVRWPVTRRT